MVLVTVVGAGVVGLAAARALSRRGHDVVCFEAGTPMGARSVGDSRIFRYAHTDPALVAAAVRARELWAEWEVEAGPLFSQANGLVLTGTTAEWEDAMAAAGVDHQFVDPPPVLARDVPDPALLDPAGAVIDVRATARYLRTETRRERVERCEPGAVWTSAGRQRADHIVLAAGAGTHDLAEPLGVETPAALAHHARFTFRLVDPAVSPPCWLDDTLPDFSTYQHLSGAGLWSIGAHFGEDEESWARGRDVTIARSRERVVRYVRDHLEGVDDEVVDTVHCTFTPGLGDGIHIAGNDRVTVVWGDNLFKHAPAIGAAVAARVESA